MTDKETTLTPEIIETPETQELVSDVVEEKDANKNKEIIKDTKNQLGENIGRLSQRLINPPHKDPDKKEQVAHLKEELKKEKEPIIDAITTPEKTKEDKPEKKHIHEDKQEHHKEKSESKLWKKTKNILNRLLDHTPLKYITKKPYEWIKKVFKKK